jgi:hypothetical protein
MGPSTVALEYPSAVQRQLRVARASECQHHKDPAMSVVVLSELAFAGCPDCQIGAHRRDHLVGHVTSFAGIATHGSCNQGPVARPATAASTAG